MKSIIFWALSMYLINYSTSYAATNSSQSVTCKATVQNRKQALQADFINGFVGYAATAGNYNFLIEEDGRLLKLTITHLQTGQLIISNKFSPIEKNGIYSTEYIINKSQSVAVMCNG